MNIEDLYETPEVQGYGFSGVFKRKDCDELGEISMSYGSTNAGWAPRHHKLTHIYHSINGLPRLYVNGHVHPDSLVQFYWAKVLELGGHNLMYKAIKHIVGYALKEGRNEMRRELSNLMVMEI